MKKILMTVIVILWIIVLAGCNGRDNRCIEREREVPNKMTEVVEPEKTTDSVGNERGTMEPSFLEETTKETKETSSIETIPVDASQEKKLDDPWCLGGFYDGAEIEDEPKETDKYEEKNKVEETTVSTETITEEDGEAEDGSGEDPWNIGEF